MAINRNPDQIIDRVTLDPEWFAMQTDHQLIATELRNIAKGAIDAVREDEHGGFESPLAAEVFDALQDRETDKAATAAAWVSENESEFWDRYAGPLLDRLEDTEG